MKKIMISGLLVCLGLGMWSSCSSNGSSGNDSPSIEVEKLLKKMFGDLNKTVPLLEDYRSLTVEKGSKEEKVLEAFSETDGKVKDAIKKISSLKKADKKALENLTSEISTMLSEEVRSVRDTLIAVRDKKDITISSTDTASQAAGANYREDLAKALKEALEGLVKASPPEVNQEDYDSDLEKAVENVLQDLIGPKLFGESKNLSIALKDAFLQNLSTNTNLISNYSPASQHTVLTSQLSDLNSYQTLQTKLKGQSTPTKTDVINAINAVLTNDSEEKTNLLTELMEIWKGDDTLSTQVNQGLNEIKTALESLE